MVQSELAHLTLPRSLRTLTFGDGSNRRVLATSSTLPSSLQALSLTFGYRLSRSLRRVTLPRSMRTLAFGHDDEFAQSLEGVVLSRGV